MIWRAQIHSLCTTRKKGGWVGKGTGGDREKRNLKANYAAQGQHIEESPLDSLARRWWRVSKRDIFSPVAAGAEAIAVERVDSVQEQQDLVSDSTSQAGFSQTSSHLGRGQVVGLAQDQEQAVSSQRGAQLASGATQVVWHSAGAQTVSHFGQSSFSHMSLGHLTEHSGCSQWTVHLAHSVS